MLVSSDNLLGSPSRRRGRTGQPCSSAGGLSTLQETGQDRAATQQCMGSPEPDATGSVQSRRELQWVSVWGRVV